MSIPAEIADLVRLENEIEEALLKTLNNPTDPRAIAKLKRRKDHLREEIENLLHDMECVGRWPH